MSTMALFKGILNTIGHFLFFSSDEECTNTTPVTIAEAYRLDWNMALMINAARRTTALDTIAPFWEIDHSCSYWLDEDGNPVPYNDGLVSEYPRM